MQSKTPSTILSTMTSNFKGILASLSYSLNTVFICTPIFILAFFKFIVPISFWQNLCSTIILWLAELWVKINSFSMQALNNINFHVTGDTDFKANGWYLVISNHQSWADIVTMQHVLQGKIPFLKFFLKQQLIYVPFLGLAWWALDFPFMKRFSKSYLKKYPHQKGKDIEATKKACEKFKTQPISVVNFVEGTRFTEQKKLAQNNAFKHLLRPKAGGSGYVMTLLGEQIDTVVNLTIRYPNNKAHAWKFLSGQYRDIYVHIEQITVTQQQRGDYINDEKFRARFQQWISALWHKKDDFIESKTQTPNQKQDARQALTFPD